MRQTSFDTPFAFNITPMVKRLLIANTGVFLVTLVVGAAVGPGVIVDWFAFSPSRILTRPWGVVTYMFLHGGFWHLFFNMLILFFFGPPLESRWGGKEFLKYYLVSGLGGVALSFLFAPYSIIGASAAVYGVMLAFAMNWPNAPIYIWGIFPVKAKWLVAFLFIVSLTSAVGGGGGGIAHFAHLGGILGGFLYLKSDWRPGRSKKTRGGGIRARKLAIVPGEEPERRSEARARKTDEREHVEEAVLDEVDRILDKISARGMGSLTEKERRVLDEVSRRHRSN